MKNGFTLFEILVVMAIVAIVGTIMVMIFANTLRGSNKSQILAVIKQNGQAVLGNMDRAIRDADNVVCVSNLINPGPTLVIIKNGCYNRYRFIAPAPSPNPTQNGQIQQDNPQPDPAAPCLQNSPAPSPTGIAFFIDNVCTDPMVSPNILTDTNTQTGVSLQNGSFTRDKPAGFRDQVTVKFDLGPGVALPKSLGVDPVTFQTTVQLR